MRRAVIHQADSRSAKGLEFAAVFARTRASLSACISNVRTRIRSCRIRYVLTLFVLLVLPVVNSGWSVSAGFVVDVSDSTPVIASGQTSDQGVVVTESASCGSGASFSDTLRRIAPNSSSTQNVRPPVEFPVRSDSQVPFDGGSPSPFAPPQKPPVNYHSSHGMGGSQTHQGAAAAVSAVTLPSVPVVVGPELAMRLFAREADIHIEELAGRLFRPPRA